MAHELTGTVSRIKFSGNDFVIATLRDGPAVKGPANHGDLKPDLTYRFFGKYNEHPTFGKQFLFESYALDRPHDQYGVTAYLSREADGVGAMTAGKLWDAFGSDAVEVLQADPLRAVAAGCCSEKVARRAAASLALRAGTQKTRIDLLDLFAGLGFPGQLVPRLVETWGVAAPSIVREDPFRLLFEEMPGCGFKRVDDLSDSLGLPHASPRRLAACAWHAVHGNKEGHTWLREEDVRSAIFGVIGDGDPDDAIAQAVAAKLLERRGVEGRNWLAVPRKAAAEGTVVRSLARLLSVPPELWPEADTLPDLSDHQKSILRGILGNGVAVLTGSPGTGKTFCAARVIKAICRSVPPDEIAVCAPTGKAAVRITQAMQSYGVRLEARTIHSLLAIKRNTRDGYVFAHDRDNPLPHKVVVIDELSMVDTDLLAALLDALEPGTHVLAVGDPHQLAPVGHGAPLRDVIASGLLPTGELTEIRRNSGQIIEACHAIKRGYRYETCPAFDDGVNNFRSLEVATPEGVVATVRAACRRLAERAAAAATDGASAPPGFAGFDPVEDVQVLCLINHTSLLGRFALNQMLQAELNPGGQGGDTHPFRVGDKVICTKNDKRPVVDLSPGSPEDAFDGWYATSAQERERYVANGDMGRVLAVSPGKIVVRFRDPLRTVLVAVPPSRRVSDEGDEETTYGTIDLGYAITTHRSQGSEWKFVIIPIDECDRARRVASRELLYTAISRAKWRCLLVGRRAVADEWCQTVTMKRRKTLLRERLMAAAAKIGARK